jgi:phage-related protein
MSSVWSFGGTTLASLGKVTLINDYLDVPERRGNNQVIPYQHGAIFAKKYYDSRVLTFGMAITAASATALETTFDTMRALFAPLTQQILSNTREDGTIRTANATVNKSIQVNRITNTLAKVVVEFELADPIFRLSTAIADNTTVIDATPHAMTVTNPGTVEELNPTIVIHGAFTSITITNSTNGASLTYTGAIGTGETVTIGTLNNEYYATLSTGSTNVIGNVTHSGSAALLPLNVGANTLAITNAGRDGNSTVKVTFFAPFL